MKPIKITQTIFILLILLTFPGWWSGTPKAFAEMAAQGAVPYLPPQPPADNPHPPITEQDKKRVAFADEVIQKILMADVSGFSADGQPVITNNDNTINVQITADCMVLPECLKYNKSLQNYVYSLRNLYGPVLEFRHTHVIPWAFENFERKKNSVNSNDTEKLQAKPTQKFFENKAAQESMAVPVLQKDEYMLHSYVKLGSRNPRWYHVNLVVSENAQGNLEFRRFFIVPIPSEDAHMPPGVVC
jgi:hypothetical protein